MCKNIDLFDICLKEKYINEDIYNYLSKNVAVKCVQNFDKKKISVIIPTYKREKLLYECIESIIKQSYQNFEIIVVDDFSLDNIDELLQKRFNDNRIRTIVNQNNSGAGISRKNGFLASSGDYIIFCDDDDYFIDFTYFQNIIDIFENESISMICSNSFVFDECTNSYSFNKLNLDNIISSKDYLSGFQFKYMKPYSTFTAAFRKNVLEKADFKNMVMMNDSSIYLRALTKSNLVYFNRNVVGAYRVHSKNITFNIKIDFLIANLHEKKLIYDLIVKEKIILNSYIWLLKQVDLTVKYYICCSNPNYSSVLNIFSWINRNVDFGFILVIKLTIYYFLNKIKKIIRKKR